MDLADPRLKGKVTFPPPGDITAGGLLLGLASELGKDYKDPEQMKEVVDWVIDEHRPRTSSSTRPTRPSCSSCFGVGRGRRGRRSGTASPGSSTSAATPDAALLVPPTVYPGQRLPVGPEGRPAPGARPGLHQLAARQGRPVPECLADRSRPWSELQRGLPRSGLRRPDPGLVHQADYYTYFPTLDQIKSSSRRSTGRPTTPARRSSRTTTPRSSASRPR